MPDYAVCGGRLRSALPLPGLAPLSPGAPADWTLEVADRPAPAPRGAPLAEQIAEGLRIRLFATGAGWRLTYDDTGSYDISADGTALTWYRVADAPAELVQADVLGRALALALAARGWIALHASAVTLGGRGVAFLAPKEHGKSTLAAALTLAGGRFVSDDMAVLDPGPPLRLLPGVPLMRLWHETADHLRERGFTATRVEGIKLTLAGLPADRLEPGRVPLAAVYVVEGADLASVRTAARRTRLAPMEATLALLAHAKMGPLLVGPLAAAHLAWSAALVGAVPVYRLRIARGLDRLPEVVGRIRRWHPAARTAAR